MCVLRIKNLTHIFQVLIRSLIGSNRFLFILRLSEFVSDKPVCPVYLYLYKEKKRPNVWPFAKKWINHPFFTVSFYFFFFSRYCELPWDVSSAGFSLHPLYCWLLICCRTLSKITQHGLHKHEFMETQKLITRRHNSQQRNPEILYNSVILAFSNASVTGLWFD